MFALSLKGTTESTSFFSQVMDSAAFLMTAMLREGVAINFNTICRAARVSKTFLYDPKHSDLAEQIRSLRRSNPQSSTAVRTNANKTDSAKDAQIVRFKERIRTLEEQVRTLQEENEQLYGKISTR